MVRRNNHSERQNENNNFGDVSHHQAEISSSSRGRSAADHIMDATAKLYADNDIVPGIGDQAGSNGKEYIQVLPVRQEVNSETVSRELYGLHRHGSGKKLPLDMEKYFNNIQSVPVFEFLIYKPPNRSQFYFLIGTDDDSELGKDKLEPIVRSKYPENFQYDRKQFDLSRVFQGTPHVVRFDGVEERRKDWMTTLTTFQTQDIDRSPLASVLESFVQEDEPIVYQVVFEPRADWSPKAERQKGMLKQGAHTLAGQFLQTTLDAVLGTSDAEQRQRHSSDTPEEVGGTIRDSQVDGVRHGTDRLGQIDLKDPGHTYNITIRVMTESQSGARSVTDSQRIQRGSPPALAVGGSA